MVKVGSHRRALPDHARDADHREQEADQNLGEERAAAAAKDFIGGPKPTSNPGSCRRQTHRLTTGDRPTPFLPQG